MLSTVNHFTWWIKGGNFGEENGNHAMYQLKEENFSHYSEVSGQILMIMVVKKVIFNRKKCPDFLRSKA